MKKVALLICICWTSLFSAYAQKITTIAGTGVSGFSGDGGPAILAQLTYIQEVYCDKHKNLYLSTASNRMRKIDTSSTISTFAGDGTWGYGGDGGPAVAAQLKSCPGIAADAKGNIYFADGFNYYVRKIDTLGIITPIAGTGLAGNSGDGGPAIAAQVHTLDLCIDKIGNIYLCDGVYIRKIDTFGIISTIAGTGYWAYGGDGGPAILADIVTQDIAIDNVGNLYVTDHNAHRIRKIDTAGIITTIAGNGTSVSSGDGGPALLAGIPTPTKLATDINGNIYVASYTDRRIRKINPAGIITTFAGNGTTGYSGDGGPAILAQIWGYGLTLNGPGELYIADYSNNVIRLVHDDTVRFTHGPQQLLNICSSVATPLDTLLTIADIDSAQQLSWSLISPPMHGTASIAYVTAATGLPVTPTGLTYTPTTGYLGTDTFIVRVYDEMLADTTMICVTVYPTPLTGTLSGPDTICVGDTLTLTGAASGGSWYSSDTAIAKVNTAGTIAAISAGTDTISYTITIGCTAVATHTLVVLPASLCDLGVTNISSAGINIFPNPNNGTFTITAPRPNTELQVTITNIMGQVIQTTRCQPGKNISLNTPGNYFVRITGGDVSVTKRVVVE